MRSWKKEYYPVEAAKVPEALAVVASLRKWIGLRPENLQRHGLVKVDGSSRLLSSRSEFYIDDKSCSLCHYYITGERCTYCPLNQVLGHPCCVWESTPYQWWCRTGDPEFMISALRVALLKDLSDYESCVVRPLLSLVDDPSCWKEIEEIILRAAEAK
jgi:hypothetical protein